MSRTSSGWRQCGPSRRASAWALVSCALLAGAPWWRLAQADEPAPVPVTFTIEPEGADVWLDAAALGRAPLMPQPVPPGRHVLVARMPSFEEGRLEFDVPAAGPVPPVVLRLVPAQSQVTVTANISGGMLLVDGHPVGPLPLAQPLRLPPGTHFFRAVAAGYEPAEARQTVGPGAVTAVVLELRPAGQQPWWLAGNSRPPPAAPFASEEPAPESAVPGPRNVALGLTLLKEHGFGGLLRLRVNHVALDLAGGALPVFIMAPDFRAALSAHASGSLVLFFSGDQRPTQHGLRLAGAYDQVLGPGGGAGWVGEWCWPHFVFALGAGLQIYPLFDDYARKYFDLGSEVDMGFGVVQPYLGLNLFWYAL
ncbi:MAG: PEGA domain-containing protein [Deltaproteobacteria bacterium]|nr:PEGA domain-containing protein [Deltaproteobacteria bacterium]